MTIMEPSGRKSPWIVEALLLSGILLACTQDRVSGGNSSETPNTLAGRLVDTSGRVRVGDTVMIRPAEWIADDQPFDGLDKSWQTTTDSSGRFQFVGVPSGTYVVESKGALGGFLSEEISVGAGRSVADLGTDTAFALQEVVGRVIADSSEIDSGAKVNVCGTDHATEVSKAGVFRFKGLPVGKVKLLALLGASSSSARAKDEFRLPREGLITPRFLAPTKFVDEDYSRWPHMRRARLHFSPAGWYLSSDQPLVPIRVRLDASVIPGPWEPTGSGLRFTDSVGNKLPYEIEIWDPVAHRAEVWVRLLQADKGSDRHSISMYWGRADAPSWSDGSRVFDTAQGWVGVWHLSGSDPWRDVTANRLRLVPTRAAVSKGLIENGVVMVPGSGLVASGAALQGLQDATTSLWGKIDSFRTNSVLARLGSPDAPDSSSWVLGLSDSSGVGLATFRTQNALRSGAAGMKAPFQTGRWASFASAFTRNSPRTRLVVDDSAQAAFLRDSFVVRAKPDVFAVGGGFTGLVDEIRLRKVGAHPDAMRLQWGADRDASPVLEWLP